MRSTTPSDVRATRRAGAPVWKSDTAVQPLIAVADSDNFERQTLAEAGDCVALFGARWCAPAYRLAERLNDIAERRPLTALWVDIDDLPMLARRYQVTALPAMVLLRNGQVIAQRIGDLDTEALEDWLAGAGPT
jgi:thioredoxin-like negative regulator of GroEL